MIWYYLKFKVSYGWESSEDALMKRVRAGVRSKISPGAKNLLISVAASSAEDEAWMMFSWFDMAKSPRIVPGAAWRPLVTPVIERTTFIASTPSSTITITGEAVIEATTEGKKGRSTRWA